MRPTLAGIALLAAGLAATPAAAQPQLPAGAAPEIRAVLTDSQRVLDRLKLVVGLTNAEEQKQYATLKDFVDVFLIGVDPAKPVRFDVQTDEAATRYRMFVPVEPGKFTDFWKLNLVPLGIPVHSYPKVPGLFQLGGQPTDAFTGFMRYDPKDRNGYAVIAEKIEDLPADARPPLETVKNLLGLGYDVAAELTNTPGNEAARLAHFQSQKTKTLGQLQRDAAESASDFEARRYMAELQFDQTGRVYAEAQKLFLGSKLDPKTSVASGAMTIDALPGTSLAAAIDAFGKTPSRFAGMPRDEQASSSGRINYPLDKFQRDQFLELMKRVRAAELEDMAAAKDATAEQKTAGAAFINALFDRLDEGLAAVPIDGFVEITRGDKAAGGKLTMVGGLLSPDGKKWDDVIELLPKTRRASNLKMNTGEHAGVSLHELTLTKEEHPGWYEIFGGGTLLAGTSKDAIWYAAGPNADAALKKAIDEAAQPGQPTDAVIAFRGELAPWTRILDAQLGTELLRDIWSKARDSFSEGVGVVTVNMTRTATGLESLLAIDRGVLRVIGKELTKFSKENLAE